MPKEKRSPSVEDAAREKSPLIDDHCRAGLALLWQASCYSRDAGGEPWDFALEIEKLYAAGLTTNHLRWLVAKKMAVHGEETSIYGDPHRTFCFRDGFLFRNTTCFVLTPCGVAFAAKLLKDASTTPQATQAQESASLSCGKPCWNPARRELSLNGTVVKVFRVPAPNQELILLAFEEEGWPAFIDDPLPVKGDMDPRTRLHDAINRLNGCQQNRLIRFHGNGLGDGIAWVRRTPTELPSTDSLESARTPLPTT